MSGLTRRKMLAGAAPVISGAAVALRELGSPSRAAADMQMDHAGHAAAHEGHSAFSRGEGVDNKFNGFDPTELLRDFDYGKTKKLANGQTVREWELIASDKEIEIAPGVRFAAWTYNGRIPGPTLRAQEGDLLRITFVNASSHPHTIHFHGIHPSAMDGVPGLGAGQIMPGGRTTYEFEAQPAGLHLYHCHVRPLAEHIAKGLYGAFIIDPKDSRAKADEMVMVMNGFDTNFDLKNEFYAVNTIAFAYMNRPIKVKQNELVRIYLVNTLEYDPINSFHLHGNFFDYIPTGIGKNPTEYTDTVMQCQGQRGIIEVKFPHTGRYMFHAHQSEFAELGWQGFFEVGE